MTTGELNLMGLRIIPDPGARIGIDPKQHTIDTTGKVRVVQSAADIDITLWHDEIHAKVPTAEGRQDLLDFSDLAKPIVKGFPIEGDIDIKIAGDGVDVPISLSLPKYFGGVTAARRCHASLTGGLDLKSLEFKVGDANFGALELKDVDVSYTLEGNVWKGSASDDPRRRQRARCQDLGRVRRRAFKQGSLDVGLPYPGIPLDDSNPPPQLYLSRVGLGLGLDPLSFTGSAGLGLIPAQATG